MRRRSLAAARQDVEPVSTATLGRFLPDWHHLGRGAGGTALYGLDGVLTVVEQLAGVPLPASALEPLILAPRVRDYSPTMLDELTSTGEVVWSGAGSISAKDGWVVLHPADLAPMTLAAPEDLDLSPVHRAILDSLEGGGAYFFRQLAGAVAAGEPSATDANVAAALWELVWGGYIAGDTLAPLRALIGDTSRATPAHRTPRRAPRGRMYRPRPAMPSHTGPPTVSGRWSLLPEREPDPTIRAHATAELLLERYGVVTRGAVVSEGIPGGFATMYKVLTRFEERGRCRRGYFVDSLGGAQFSTPPVVDRLRSFADSIEGRHDETAAVTLAACDPANPYGAALAWPKSAAPDDAPRHRPGRKAGGLVVLVDGGLVLFIERGGRTMLTFDDDPGRLRTACASLAAAVKRGGVDKIVVEKVDGDSIHGHTFAEILAEAGFSATPRGYRLRF